MAVKNNLFLLVMAILVAVGCNNAGRKDSEALRTCLEYPTWSTGCFIVPVVLTCNSVPDTMGTCCIVAANAGYFMDRYMNDDEEFSYPENFDEMSWREQDKWYKKCNEKRTGKYYRLLIDNNNTLNVDSTLYAEYYPHRVVVDEEIQSLYQKEGIVGVLNKYLDEEGWLEKYIPWEMYVTRDTIVMEEGYDGKMEERHYKIRTSELAPGYTYHGQGVNVDYIMYLASLHNIYFYCYYHYPDEYCGYYISQWDDDKELEKVHYIQACKAKKRKRG